MGFEPATHDDENLLANGLGFARPWQCHHLSQCELSNLGQILRLVFTMSLLQLPNTCHI
jgi:hypothetical protein